MAKKKKEDNEEVEAKPKKEKISSSVAALMQEGKTLHQAQQVVSLRSRD